MGTVTNTRKQPKFPGRCWTHGDSQTAGYHGGPKVASWAQRTNPPIYSDFAKDAWTFAKVVKELFDLNSNYPPIPPTTATSGSRYPGVAVVNWGPRPERFIMMTGINDILNNGWDGPTLYSVTAVNMINGAAAIGADVVWITLPPFPEDSNTWYTSARDTARKAFNQALITNQGLITSPGGKVLDIEALMDNGSGRMPAQYGYAGDGGAADGLHLGSKGHQRIADAIQPYVLPEL